MRPSDPLLAANLIPFCKQRDPFGTEGTALSWTPPRLRKATRVHQGKQGWLLAPGREPGSGSGHRPGKGSRFCGASAPAEQSRPGPAMLRAAGQGLWRPEQPGKRRLVALPAEAIEMNYFVVKAEKAVFLQRIARLCQLSLASGWYQTEAFLTTFLEVKSTSSRGYNLHLPHSPSHSRPHTSLHQRAQRSMPRRQSFPSLLPMAVPSRSLK